MTTEALPGTVTVEVTEEKVKEMLEVHRQGRSVVASETREKAELYHQQIQAHGLSVTIEEQS